MTADDVISALEGLRCLVRDPQTGLYAFRVDLNFCQEYVAKWEAKDYVKLASSGLTWTPYVMGRSSALNFELGPAISAIAPREEDGDAQASEVLADSGGSKGLPNGHSEEKGDSKTQTSEMVNGTTSDDKENHYDDGLEKDKAGSEAPEQANDSTSQAEDDWAAPYADLAPTRFEVFPQVVGGRRVERPRASVPRTPSVVEPVVSTPRTAAPSASVSSSSRRKSSSARPRSSNSRRKSGGTGRGPGR